MIICQLRQMRIHGHPQRQVCLNLKFILNLAMKYKQNGRRFELPCWKYCRLIKVDFMWKIWNSKLDWKNWEYLVILRQSAEKYFSYAWELWKTRLPFWEAKCLFFRRSQHTGLAQSKPLSRSYVLPICRASAFSKEAYDNVERFKSYSLPQILKKRLVFRDRVRKGATGARHP